MAAAAVGAAAAGGWRVASVKGERTGRPPPTCPTGGWTCVGCCRGWGRRMARWWVATAGVGVAVGYKGGSCGCLAGQQWPSRWCLSWPLPSGGGERPGGKGGAARPWGPPPLFQRRGRCVHWRRPAGRGGTHHAVAPPGWQADCSRNMASICDARVGGVGRARGQPPRPPPLPQAWPLLWPPP